MDMDRVVYCSGTGVLIPAADATPRARCRHAPSHTRSAIMPVHCTRGALCARHHTQQHASVVAAAATPRGRGPLTPDGSCVGLTSVSIRAKEIGIAHRGERLAPCEMLKLTLGLTETALFMFGSEGSFAGGCARCSARFLLLCAWSRLVRCCLRGRELEPLTRRCRACHRWLQQHLMGRRTM